VNHCSALAQILLGAECASGPDLTACACRSHQALLRRYERELKQLRQELAARSQNVVDKRKLLEVEEQRKQAEQDKVWC
jgi:hypothetical protein